MSRRPHAQEGAILLNTGAMDIAVVNVDIHRRYRTVKRRRSRQKKRSSKNNRVQRPHLEPKIALRCAEKCWADLLEESHSQKKDQESAAAADIVRIARR